MKDDMIVLLISEKKILKFVNDLLLENWKQVQKYIYYNVSLFDFHFGIVFEQEKKVCSYNSAHRDMHKILWV